MKKYFWTLAVMAIFAFGFTASDEESTSSNSDSQKIEQRYRESRGRNIDYSRVVGEEAAKEEANDLIRQGLSKSDLKGIATRNAKMKYKSVGDCCNLEYFEKEYKELFTDSERQKLVDQCREAYVTGYMSALGKEYYQ